MNILFHSWAFPPNGGGVGAYAATMGRALADAGHRVVVLTGRAAGRPERETVDGMIVLRRYAHGEIGGRGALLSVLRAIDAYRIDLVEGADYLGDCAKLLSVGSRPPVLIKAHSCNALRILQESQVVWWWQRPLIRLALLRNWRLTRRETLSIQRADMLLAPSRRILEELRRQGRRLPQRCAVVPNPAAGPFSAAGPEAPGPTLLMVCRLDIGKGIQFVPRILRGVAAAFPGVRLEIAGADGYARGLGSLRRWLVRRLGDMTRHVRFLGHLDRGELESAYRRAWVVLIPSRWDNFPTVMLEAMSMGKPVVASPHGGMPEMLDGTLGRTAPPDSDRFVALVNGLLADRRRREAMGDSLLQKARAAYAPEVVVSRYMDFLRASEATPGER